MDNRNTPFQNLLLAAEYRHLWTRTLHAKRHEFVAQEGDAKGPWMFYVESGAVRVTHNIDGEDVTIRLGYAGSLVSALPSFLEDLPVNYSIQALKASKLWAMHRKDLMAALETDPALARFWNTATVQLIREQLEREIDILTPSPAERYKRVLARSPRLFQEIPNKYIASYLRMTPETLSRLQKTL
eukprot:gene10260-13018_t